MARWAILGSGVISGKVADAIAAHPTAELYAIAGRNADAVDTFAAKHGIAVIYHDYDAVLADPKVDIVYIGLPNHAHLPMVRKAAAAGKAILSEKSLTVTTDDAEDLIEVVEEAEVFFVEGLMYLAHPLFARLPDLLRDERLGRIRSIRACYAADIKGVVNPEGGGTLYNLGCYPASLMQFVMQSAFPQDDFTDRKLAAVGRINDAGNVSETSAVVRFGNDVQAVLQSTDDYGTDWAFDVVGERGTLRFHTNPWLPAKGDNVIEICPHKGESERIVVTDGQDAFWHQIRVVETCVARGMTEAPRPSPRWVDSLEIMDFLNEWEAVVRR